MIHHISRAKARSDVLIVGDVGDFHYVKCTDNRCVGGSP
jgi:hypothetical protein